MANLANCPPYAKLKPSKLVLTINNLLADLLIHQTFFCQVLKTSQFAKLFHYTVNCYSTFLVAYINSHFHFTALWLESFFSCPSFDLRTDDKVLEKVACYPTTILAK